MALTVWATDVLQWRRQRSNTATWSKSFKRRLSSDCGLQLDRMKLESLVIADQHAAVNTVPGLVHTACQVMGVRSARIG